VINSRVDVDFIEALDMLDVGEELLGKLCEEENSNRDALTEPSTFCARRSKSSSIGRSTKSFLRRSCERRRMQKSRERNE
jgi:hypothetical protein